MGAIRRDRAVLAAALAALVAAAAIVAGCGGDDGGDGDGVSAEEYVTEVCGSLSDLTGAVEEGQSELQQELTSPEQGRDVLITFLGDAAEAAGEARTTVEEAGVPDVDEGAMAADTISSAMAELEQAFENARGQAEDISTDSPEAFSSDAQELAGEIGESSQRIQESLEAVEDNDELSDAADEAEACEDV